MNIATGHLIEKVSSGSPAAAAGIKPGWKLYRIDNQQIGDIIDYKIMESGDTLRLLLQDKQGVFHRLKIGKPAGSDLGLHFSPPTISALQKCCNNCIFCFVDQNPGGMRPALYIKDDDYRLSFLYGNFITLNRITEPELKRITRLQLSPLYVSVHTTNPALRQIMFGTKKAIKGLLNLKRLVNAGIRIHAQVVLCPGFNTGTEMEHTIKDLGQMGPNLSSVALVPVGLTGHRSGLERLKQFDPVEAEELVEKIKAIQLTFLREKESRFVFLADEFYNLAGLAVPGDNEYEGYPQLENGVGLTRLFLDELEMIKKQLPDSLETAAKISIATGRAAESIMKQLAMIFAEIDNLTINLKIIDNKFFGDQVTVSGLLTGGDLLAALEGDDLGDALFISKALLKDQSNCFLDDLDLNEIEKVLAVPVHAVSGPLELLSRIREIGGSHKSLPEGTKVIDE